jgi:type IV pilus assembly protein PilX
MNTSMQPKDCVIHTSREPRRERGVVLLFALIALTIMLVGAVALISSFNTSLITAGNIGFKRDLVNQAELAAKTVLEKFNAGALDDSTKRAATLPTENYSAVVLATNNQGIPVALLSKTNFSPTSTWRLPDVSGTAGQNVTVRYLLDRLCTAPGNAQTALEAEQCVRAPVTNVPKGLDAETQRKGAEFGDSKQGVAAAVAIPAAYRLTVRAMGPRNTEAYYQMTFTEPLPPPAALPP